MRRAGLAVAALIGLAAFAACGGDGAESADDGTCAPAIRWNGARYIGDVSLTLDRGAKLGEATTVACEGLGGDEVVTVVRPGDVPPPVAVAVVGDPGGYEAEGYLSALSSHPLHRFHYGSADRPAPRRRGCSRRFRWNAEIVVTPAGGAHLAVRTERDGRELLVEIHARTRVRGFTRAGLPYLRRGDRVQLSGAVCRPEDGDVFRVDAVDRPRPL